MNKTKLNSINKKLNSINKKLNSIKRIPDFQSVKLTNKSLMNNQRNIKYPIGNALYILKKKIKTIKYFFN